MRIGVSLTTAHTDVDAAEGARMIIERARVADQSGLDSLFMGDHHATSFSYYQNTPMLGRLLAEWGNRPAGALYLLPLWHPLILAEHIATLATIMQDRFILQCGIGDPHQAKAIGVNPGQLPSHFEQSLSIMRRLWAGEEVSSDGRWKFGGGCISPRPPKPVEVWIAAVAPPAIDRTARIGDGWLAAPSLSFDDARQHLASYFERCEAHGRPRGTAAIRRDIYVGESDAEAEATAGPIVEAGYRGFPEGAAIVGGPEKVADAFREHAAMGYTDVIVRNLVTDQAKALGCLERLGKVREQVAAA